MTYSVYQHWDPLKVCVVGRSYPPEFYSWIESPRLRSLFERIAIETEQDYQGIIKVLNKFNVDVVRPNVPEVAIDEYLTQHRRIPGPISMNPRDQMIMVGNQFFLYPYDNISIKTSGRTILEDHKEIAQRAAKFDWWQPILDKVKKSNSNIITNFDDSTLDAIPANGITRIGKDLYFGCSSDADVEYLSKHVAQRYFSDYRCHFITTGAILTDVLLQ